MEQVVDAEVTDGLGLDYEEEADGRADREVDLDGLQRLVDREEATRLTKAATDAWGTFESGVISAGASLALSGVQMDSKRKAKIRVRAAKAVTLTIDFFIKKRVRGCRQGLTLVRLPAPLERFEWNRGCAQGWCSPC